MITMKEYVQNPCGTLSIPFWKWKMITLPENMFILHEHDYLRSDWEDYRDEQYFRLLHKLKGIPVVVNECYSVRTAGECDISEMVEIINASYKDIQTTEKDLMLLTKSVVYDPTLWILAVDRTSNDAIGCAIADFDSTMGEGIVEWVQVLPEYRKRGIGKLLVSELLNRMCGKASFVTVSGKVNNETRPERLYRSCGFGGNDVWHILVKE